MSIPHVENGQDDVIVCSGMGGIILDLRRLGIDGTFEHEMHSRFHGNLVVTLSHYLPGQHVCIHVWPIA